MKNSRRGLGAILMCLLVLVLPGFPKGKKSLTIYEESRLNDSVLKPGQYKVEVAENGGTSQVMIYKGKELVARSIAQVEKLEGKADRNSLKLSLEGSKTPKIIEIRLSGEQQAYKIGGGDGGQVSQKATQ